MAAASVSSDSGGLERRLASETVLTDADFFSHIVSFQDGLPGLLRELKRDTRAGDGFEPDLPTAAAKHRKLRAFEMIHALRQLPEYAGRRDLKFRNAVNKACEVGDAAILRWIIEGPTADQRLPHEEIEPLWNLAVVYYKPGDVSIFEVLAEYFTPEQVAALDKNTWRSIRHVDLLKWLCDRYAIQLHDDMFARAINRSDAAFVDYWISNRPDHVPKHILSNLLRRGDAALFSTVFFNNNRVLDEVELLEMVTIATKEEDLTLLRMLYTRKPQLSSPTMPVEVLELAAERGLLRFVEELCMHHSEIVSTGALQLAATNGHLAVLEFLCQRCNPVEIPGAMDKSATNGFLNVVRYLHENRSGECTAEALVGALENKHDEIASWLMENRSEVRSAAGLSSLLTRGKTSKWLRYREEWNLVGNVAVDGAERLGEAVFQAGQKGDLTMIRFIVETLGRQDLLIRAYEGAVEIGSLGWLFAIHELDSATTKSVKFSTIQRAIEVEERAYRFETPQAERRDVLKWLIMQCEDKDESLATSEVLTLLDIQHKNNPYRDHYHRYYSHNVDLGVDVASWHANRKSTAVEMEMLRRTYMTSAFSFANRGVAFDWVIEYAVQSISPRFESWSQRYLTPEVEKKDPWGLGVWTLTKHAVARNDLVALRAFHEMNQRSGGEAHEYRIDNEVLRAAIATGHVGIVQWYVSVYGDSSLSQPDLLDWAVKFGQASMAEWLLVNFPQCCTSFNADRLDVLSSHANSEIIDWCFRLDQAHPPLHKHFQPLPIACTLAREGKVELLQRLLSYDSVHCKAAHLVNHATEGDQFHAIKFIVRFMEEHHNADKEPLYWADEESRNQVESAVKTAASQGTHETVEFLCHKFPSADYSAALREAARLGHVRILRYLLKNHLPSSGDVPEIRSSAFAAVRRVGFFCHTHGSDIL